MFYFGLSEKCCRFPQAGLPRQGLQQSCKREPNFSVLRLCFFFVIFFNQFMVFIEKFDSHQPNSDHAKRATNARCPFCVSNDYKKDISSIFTIELNFCVVFILNSQLTAEYNTVERYHRLFSRY